MDHLLKKKKDCAETTAVSMVTPAVITKETLPAFFENLHHLLWSQAGLSPERALEHMTFFFSYRLVEAQVDDLGLPQECRWTYIASLDNDNDMFETIKNGILSFRLHSATKPFFRMLDIREVTILGDIVRLMNKIPLSTLQETDTLGDIFEYMLGRGMSTMADEGQYFTNRKICRKAFELAYGIKKSVRREDGSLCTFADWFCGTGGFAVEYVRGVSHHFPEVQWKEASKNLYCQDMNQSYVTTTLLNLLIHTGVSFPTTHTKCSNSFYNPITRGHGASFPGVTIDYCFMNPPYGGDKTKGVDYKFAYSKIGGEGKRFLVNEDIQSIGIEHNEKVSAGVQLALSTLSDKGVCCIVLPQGFFFDSSAKYVELRRKLVEEYKVHYVVDLVAGSFINTPTKTCMLVFQKGVGPTDLVPFIDMSETVLVTATLDNLRAKKFSLYYKQYWVASPASLPSLENGEVKTVKLGDVVDAYCGTRPSPSEVVEGGNFPMMGGGKTKGFHSTSNRPRQEVVLTRVGNTGVTWMEDPYYLTDNAFALVSKDPQKLLTKYLYYYMMVHVDRLRNQYSGTAQPVISKTRLYDMEMNLPPVSVQHRVVQSEGWEVMFRHEQSCLHRFQEQALSMVDGMGYGHSKVRLGDLLVPLQGKKYLVKEGAQTGKYPLLCSSKDGKVKWLDTFTFQGPFIAVGNGGEANFRYVEEFNASSHVLVYNTTEKALCAFVYYSLQNARDEIHQRCFQGTGLMNLNISMFMDTEIALPPLEEQQTLEPLFQEIQHKQKRLVLYEQRIKEVAQKLIL
jgi:type I restriction-modification system DNA methylase subunit